MTDVQPHLSGRENHLGIILFLLSFPSVGLWRICMTAAAAAAAGPQLPEAKISRG